MKKSILTTLGIVAISGALAAVNPAAARGPHEGGGLFARVRTTRSGTRR